MSGKKRLSDDELRKHRAESAARWRAKNKEYWLAYNKELRTKYPERYRAYKKAYKDKNPERVIELRKLGYARRRQQILEKNKAWYFRNRDRIILQKNEYERLRKLRDPAFRCVRLLRNRIVEVLKYQRAIKSCRTKELIGCDRDVLVHWIESKFTNGMSWENHGVHGWHIDHIRPCASFDLSDREQQKQCFNYTNLQPMWAKENQIKSDKWHYQNI
jgi:hypothetical protein